MSAAALQGQGGPSEQHRRDIEDLDRIDREAAIGIAGVWQGLIEDAPAQTGDPLRIIAPQVDRFVIQQDALTAVPRGGAWTPVLLCLYYFQSWRLVRTDLVTGAEFTQVLEHWGFGADEVKGLEAQTADLRALDPQACVQRLIDHGVALTGRLPEPARDAEPEAPAVIAST